MFPNTESPTQTMFRLVNKQKHYKFFLLYQAFELYFQINDLENKQKNCVVNFINKRETAQQVGQPPLQKKQKKPTRL